jgi:hypothetical protein
MSYAAIARRLRDAERAAKEVLERGCAEDLSALEHFVARPLQKARAQLEARTSPSAAEQIAQRCAGEVFANGSVRFRARFSMYASALAYAERRFLVDAATLVAGDAPRLRPPRRITLPRIDLRDDWAIVARCDACSADQWFEELRKGVCCALEREVDRARRVLLERGAASLIRTRVVLRLALRGPIQL